MTVGRRDETNSPILVWQESYFAGGADWSLIDLLTHWPDPNDRFVLYVNRTHEGLSLLKEKMPRRVTVRTYASPLEILNGIRKRFPATRKPLADGIAKLAALAGGIAACLPAFFRQRYDLLLMNNGGYPGGISHFIAAVLSRICGITNRVMIVRNYPLQEYSGSLQMHLAGVICRNILNAVVAVSEDLRQSLIARAGLPAGLIHVIHNGITTENKTGARSGAHGLIGREGPSVGIIGTLEARKGHRELFRAWQQVNKRFPEAKLYILSSRRTGDRPALERLARTLGIEASIRWIAFTPDIGEVYKRLDVVVVPSQENESFGRVVAEAMAFKKPVIATRVGGIPEILTEGQEGFLVGPKDTDGLASRIIQLISASKIRKTMGERGFTTFKSRFTAVYMAKNYHRLLRGLEVASDTGLHS